MQSTIRILALFCSIMLFCGPIRAAHESRTWTDSSGKFEVEATLVKVDGDQVSLKKSDGKFLSLKKSQLSKKDQDYLKQVAEEQANPFAGGSDAPEDTKDKKDKKARPTPVRREPTTRSQESSRREPGASSTRREPGASSTRREPQSSSSSRRGAPDRGQPSFGEPGGDVFESDPIPVDLSSAISGGGGMETSWDCDPDAASDVKMELRPRNIAFRVGELPFGVWAREGGLAVYGSGDDPRALYVANVDMDNKGGDSVSVVFFSNLATGKTSSVHFKRKVELLDVSPDGSKALFRESAWGFGSQNGSMNFVHIVEIGENGLEAFAAYEPFSDDSQPGKMHNWDVDVKSGSWVDEEHVLLTSPKRIVVMNIDSGEAVWQMDASGSPTVSMSSGRKYCLVSNSSGTVLLEAATGAPVGKLDGIGSGFGRSFAFSPDGTRIATHGNDGVMLWDATTGKAEEPFYIGSANGKVQWLDNRFLLVGGRLVDEEARAPIWQYNGLTREATCFYGGYLWFLEGARADKQLLGAQLPHNKARLASQAPDAQRFCVRPGMQIALKIDGSIQNGKAEIEEHMKKILEANGLEIKADAPVVVQLKVTQEKEETTNYSVGHFPTMFARGGGTEIKYRPCKFSVEFQRDGKTLWNTSRTTSSPSSVSLDEVQKSSLQSVVDEAMKKANEDYKGWFLGVKIPKKIPEQEKIGQSTLGPNGIQDR